MKQVNIFLGGEVALLEGNEGYRPTVIDTILSKLNSRRNANRFYVVKTFTDLKNEYAPEGQQEHYNRYVRQKADIAIFIFDGKIGDKTQEEIENACKSFDRNKHPTIYFYGTNLDDSDNIVKYLNSKKQYYRHFSSKEELKQLVYEQLTQLNLNPVNYIFRDSIEKVKRHKKDIFKYCFIIFILYFCFNILLCYDQIKTLETLNELRLYRPKNWILGKIFDNKINSTKEYYESMCAKLENNYNCHINKNISLVRLTVLYEIMNDMSNLREYCDNSNLPNFASKYEVSIREWDAFFYNKMSESSKPISDISFFEVQAFIDSLKFYSGKEFDLPSEKEWILLAKANQKYNYAGSDKADSVAWFALNSNYVLHGRDSLLEQNAFDLFNLSGNVAEMCRDTMIINDGKEQIVKGGGYNSYEADLQIGSVDYLTIGEKSKNIGFRLIIK